MKCFHRTFVLKEKGGDKREEMSNSKTAVWYLPTVHDLIRMLTEHYTFMCMDTNYKIYF